MYKNQQIFNQKYIKYKSKYNNYKKNKIMIGMGYVRNNINITKAYENLNQELAHILPSQTTSQTCMFKYEYRLDSGFIRDKIQSYKWNKWDISDEELISTGDFSYMYSVTEFYALITDTPNFFNISQEKSEEFKNLLTVVNPVKDSFYNFVDT